MAGFLNICSNLNPEAGGNPGATPAARQLWIAGRPQRQRTLARRRLLDSESLRIVGSGYSEPRRRLLDSGHPVYNLLFGLLRIAQNSRFGLLRTAAAASRPGLLRITPNSRFGLLRITPNSRFGLLRASAVGCRFGLLRNTTCYSGCSESRTRRLRMGSRCAVRSRF